MIWEAFVHEGPAHERVRLMILLYLDCDIAFPSPAFARAGDGAAHGA